MRDIGHNICVESRPADAEIAALAREQHGVVARWQLLEAGLTRRQIQHRVATRRLHCLYRGVYAVGHAAVTPRGWWIAAVLACGAQALLSHRDGAALWGLRQNNRRQIEVTAQGRRGQANIQVHRGRLHPEDRERRDGIPVTSVARTLLDLAEVVVARQLARAYDEAERLGLSDLRALERVLARAHGRRGAGALTALVIERRPAPPMTRSELEIAFLELCREFGLPLPAMNAWVAGFEVDAVWHAQRVIVEIDGFEIHRTRAAFEADRARDAALQVAGYRVIRVTARMLTHDREATAATIRALLSVGAAAR